MLGCLIGVIDSKPTRQILAPIQELGGNPQCMLLAALYNAALALPTKCSAALPTMRASLNYTTPLTFSVAAGTARRLGLDAAQTANTLALASVNSA